MRLLKALSTLSSLAWAAVTPEEACWFVGFRFALTPSVVDGLNCFGLFIGDDGRIAAVEAGRRPFTSVEAMVIMREELDAMQGRDVRTPEQLAVDLRSATKGIIAYLPGPEFDLTEAIASMQKTMKILETRASGDWAAWTAEVTSPYTTVRKAIEEQYDMLVFVLVDNLDKPAWTEAIRDLHAADMFYLHDFCALVGPKVCKPKDLEHAGVFMYDMHPLYREWRSREVAELLAFPVKDWPKLEEAILRDPVNARPLASVFVQMYALSDNPKMVLLKQALVPFLCRDPLGFIMSRPELHRAQNRPVLTKFAANLMNMCSDHSTKDALEALHAFINAPGPNEPMLAATCPDTVSIVSHLSQEGVCLTKGLAGDLTNEEKGRHALSMVKAVTDVRDLLVPITYNGKEVMRFKLHTEGAMEDDLRVLGRAIGLALRYGQTLSELRLAREVALWLHPRIFARLPLETAKAGERALGLTSKQPRQLLRSIHYVSQALSAGLGIGGYARLSDSEWAALFGVAE